MEYSQEMNLASESGYCMPFAEGGDIVITKSYGTQQDESHHDGIDYETNNYTLFAMADGVVSGLAVDRNEHGPYIKIRYDKYEVTYAGLTQLYMQFGQKVRAAQPVGKSGSTLHIGVTFEGKEMDPQEFISMIYANERVVEATLKGNEVVYNNREIHTKYDNDMEEIQQLMINHMGGYFNELSQGIYSPRQRTIDQLTNLFVLGQQRGLFYEEIPNMVNPFGMADRAIPLIAKVQNLLIEDFLRYLMMRQQIYLSSVPESEKKKKLEEI